MRCARVTQIGNRADANAVPSRMQEAQARVALVNGQHHQSAPLFERGSHMLVPNDWHFIPTTIVR